MKFIYKVALLLSFTILSSFMEFDKYSSEYTKLQKYELLALKKNVIGKIYIYDLTKKEGCNKTKIKYLGTIKTNNGKRYKLLSSFFVFRAASTCHGSSSIKIYDMKNNYIGKYYVGMPYDLPDKIIDNHLIWVNSKNCNLRTTFSVDMKKGLPKNFFIPCSKDGGDITSFSNL